MGNNLARYYSVLSASLGSIDAARRAGTAARYNRSKLSCRTHVIVFLRNGYSRPFEFLSLS